MPVTRSRGGQSRNTVFKRTAQLNSATTWLLRRHDQAAVAVLACVALAWLAGWWLWHGGATGRLMEIDEAPHSLPPLAVDINEASWPELAQLPGIGETLARRIIELREREGRYSSHESLLRVTGIGPKKFAAIRPLLKPIERSDTPPTPK